MKNFLIRSLFLTSLLGISGAYATGGIPQNNISINEDVDTFGIKTLEKEVNQALEKLNEEYLKKKGNIEQYIFNCQNTQDTIKNNLNNLQQEIDKQTTLKKQYELLIQVIELSKNNEYAKYTIRNQDFIDTILKGNLKDIEDKIKIYKQNFENIEESINKYQESYDDDTIEVLKNKALVIDFRNMLNEEENKIKKAAQNYQFNIPTICNSVVNSNDVYIKKIYNRLIKLLGCNNNKCFDIILKNICIFNQDDNSWDVDLVPINNAIFIDNSIKDYPNNILVELYKAEQRIGYDYYLADQLGILDKLDEKINKLKTNIVNLEKHIVNTTSIQTSLTDKLSIFQQNEKNAKNSLNTLTQAYNANATNLNHQLTRIVNLKDMANDPLLQMQQSQ